MKIYLVTGHNSWTNKEVIRAFASETEASDFMIGLSNPCLHVVKYKKTVDLVNALLSKRMTK